MGELILWEFGISVQSNTEFQGLSGNPDLPFGSLKVLESPGDIAGV